MKKAFNTFMLMALCSHLLFIVFSPVTAAKDTGSDYSKIFIAALDADGIYADMLSSDIRIAFEREPIRFLDALSKESTEVRERVIVLLIQNQHAQSDIPYSAFKDTLWQLRNSGTANDDIVVQIDDIFLAIDTFEKNWNSPQQPGDHLVDSEMYTFDQVAVRGFIENNLSRKNIDEEFYYTIAKAYQSSPTAFAKLISDLPPEDVTYLAKGISYDLQKRDVPLEEISQSTETDNSILAIIQDEIANKVNVDLKVFEQYTETTHIGEEEDAAALQTDVSAEQTVSENSSGVSNLDTWIFLGVAFILSIAVVVGVICSKRINK